MPLKLPRWLVAILLGLSLIAVLTAAFAAWAEWPRYTARNFVALAAEGEFVDARSILRTRNPERAEYGQVGLIRDDMKVAPAERHRAMFCEQQVTFKPRTAGDILAGRCSFKLDRRGVTLTAERGVIWEPESEEPIFSFTVPIFR
jgi:hypothetical protein